MQYPTAISSHRLVPSRTSKFLYLGPDSVKNCTIHVNSKHGDVAYEVSTPTNLAETVVTKGEQSIPFATITRRRMRSDRISIDEGKAFRVTNLVKPTQGWRIFPATLHVGETVLLWKFSKDGKLVLYKGESPRVPIAWFQRSSKLVVNNLSSTVPAFLVLQPDAVEIQDSVVLSFLILEHKLRTRLRKSASSWDIFGCAS
ncbi:hypothetical protein ONZ45_g1510 [Pleurotus djamor]|nr:hypothetical protein ONZ45_g1510 [Pleurotus djamor]